MSHCEHWQAKNYTGEATIQFLLQKYITEDGGSSARRGCGLIAA
jgi:hypothetical protein